LTAGRADAKVAVSFDIGGDLTAPTGGEIVLRNFLLGKVHRAKVTRADLDYVGSITIDQDLIEAAGFLENEKVDIYDVTNGSRLSTYVIPGMRGSGEVGINGAAAHLVQKGDLVIIAAYGMMTPQEAALHRPNVVHVDEENRIVELAREERTPPVMGAAAE
jgi:aspartate 1-decarboxylase